LNQLSNGVVSRLQDFSIIDIESPKHTEQSRILCFVKHLFQWFLTSSCLTLGTWGW